MEVSIFLWMRFSGENSILCSSSSLLLRLTQSAHTSLFQKNKKKASLPSYNQIPPLSLSSPSQVQSDQKSCSVLEQINEFKGGNLLYLNCFSKKAPLLWRCPQKGWLVQQPLVVEALTAAQTDGCCWEAEEEARTPSLLSTPAQRLLCLLVQFLWRHPSGFLPCCL